MTDFSWITEKLYILPGILIGFSFHEFAHAIAAYFMGDDTAKKAGRLSIDPRDHIDILGFLSFMIAGFGWAKPVPINPWKFKNRRLGTIIVSLAGPFTNFIIAFLSVCLYYTLIIAGYNNDIVSTLIQSTIWVNVILCVFNLLPVPPLDGSKILASFFPSSLEAKFYQWEQYSNIILLVLILSRSLRYILSPMATFLLEFLDNVVYHLFLLLGIL